MALSHDVSGAIERDLKRRIKGETRFDDASRTLYSTAACMFEMVPLGGVAPRDEEDLRALVEYCGRHGIPLTARGAATSLAGQAIGTGVIVDFRHLNRVLELDPDRGWARVEPGVVLQKLNEALEPHGFFFPPDPGSAAMCTLGGMIQTNAGGIHSLKYGTTRDYLLELSAVLDTGEPATLRNQRRSDGPGGRLGEIFSQTVGLIQRHAPAIAEERPRSPKNSSGYHLYDVVNGGFVRLQRLVSGSEGTLCLVSAAKLSIRKLVKRRTLALLEFPDIERACAPVERILRLEPSALELLDETTVKLVSDYSPGLRRFGGPCLVMCEFEGDDPRELRSRALKLKKLAGHVQIVPEGEAAEIWNLRRSVSPALERLPGPRRSTRVIEDVCVEPSKVADYILGLRSILRRHRVQAAAFGHLGSGNIHVNVFLDLSRPKHQRIMQTLSFEVAELVRLLRGSLSGEHGDGLLRAPELRAQFPRLYPVFEQVKRIWDPREIFNPGKKLCSKGYRFVQDLRGSRRPGFHTAGPFRRLEKKLLQCNGCARCHDYCPIHDAVPVEESTPRAKVNLLLAAGQGRVESRELLENAMFRNDLRTCIDCRKCLTDCPAGVDLPAIAEGFLRATPSRKPVSRRGGGS
jgi:FAD/FMN-containing dehydrogenase/ferredoxin